MLDEDRAGVVGLVGEVDGAAGDLASGFEDGSVDVKAVHARSAECGQEGGVDVEDAEDVVVGDPQEAEEAGKADEVGLGIADEFPDGAGKSVDVASGEVLAVDQVDGQVEFAGGDGVVAFGVGADDGGDFRAEATGLNVVVEVLKRGPAAADKDGEADGKVVRLGLLSRYGHAGTIAAMGDSLNMDGRSEAVEVTRLAPSPTGALHLGNARTFLINWALARQAGWRMVLRVEDLDGPRIKPEASAQAVEVLRWLGMDWDEGPVYQASDLGVYESALERLRSQRLVYACRCTRKEIERAQSAPHEEDGGEVRYPGTCRGGTGAGSSGSDGEPTAWRVKVPEGRIGFRDTVHGERTYDVQAEVGDFVVATKAGLPAYQLAVVVDDARQGVTQVVRGDDLLGSTARQLWLYRLLGLEPVPTYTHLPLVVGSDGRRLAKRHGDTRLTTYRQRGVAAERVVGLLAYWSGVVGRREACSAEVFAERFEMGRLSREAVVFTQEDEAWLLNV